jgi:protein dithiol:quinone oxidoreductase
LRLWRNCFIVPRHADVFRVAPVNPPGRRALNLAGFAACAGLMAYALYAEHGLLLEPCPLCSFQRMAVVALGSVFLAAALHDPGGKARYVYTALIALAGSAGAAVAGRHVWLQNLPADQVPSCGPGLDYILDSFPIREALRLVFSGSGECASIDWRFAGLSMPAWVLIAVTLLTVLGVWNTVRRR